MCLICKATKRRKKCFGVQSKHPEILIAKYIKFMYRKMFDKMRNFAKLFVHGWCQLRAAVWVSFIMQLRCSMINDAISDASRWEYQIFIEVPWENCKIGLKTHGTMPWPYQIERRSYFHFTTGKVKLRLAPC